MYTMTSVKNTYSCDIYVYIFIFIYNNSVVKEARYFRKDHRLALASLNLQTELPPRAVLPCGGCAVLTGGQCRALGALLIAQHGL